MEVPYWTPGAKAANGHRCMLSMNLTTWLSNELVVFNIDFSAVCVKHADSLYTRLALCIDTSY